jgi:hypothetical protein
MRKLYENLTLNQSIKLSEIDIKADKLEYAANRLAVIFGVDVVEIYKREVNDIYLLNAELEKLEKLTINTKQVNKIKVGKRWFYVDYTIANLSAGQFIDIQSFASTDPHKNIHKIIASVLRPISWIPFSKPEKYDGNKHEDISNYLIDNMTILQAYPIMLFFCTLLNESLEDIQTYSLHQLQAMKEKLILSQKNGDGLQQLTI